MKLKARKYSLIFLFLFSAFIFKGCQAPLYRETQLLMGTFVEVISTDPRAANIVFSEIRHIEKLLSVYDPNSQISQLNQKGKLTVSPQTYKLLKKAKEFWQNSEGAFDISVGPLMDLWGFRNRDFRIPSEEEIKTARQKVGMDKIIFQDATNMIELTVPGMQLDCGGIAKGYAVDCAVQKLRRENIKSCLINAGGDIYCLGSRGRTAWKVAIQRPDKKAILKVIFVKDKAVATSGNSEQFFIAEGQIYSHIIDPCSGYPVKTAFSSVTVTSNDCMTADFLATAAFVLGKDKAELLASKYNSKIELFYTQDEKPLS
ncbi:MAG: FAD:protein FMN transferase [Candidatus Omnitrophica bacterium]|nr:FAD:protein FMN transferase [Candidatus Omnitrophota bacterium]